MSDKSKLKWWQLSLLGVAFTIGTGYFLGSGIAIKIGGPSVLIAFIIAACGTYLVFDVLAGMTADEPLEGSFRTYAKKAYGRWAGFSSGWVYASSEMLIMGSQLTALSLFTRFWFPHVPLWIFASVYSVLALIIIIAGTKSFDRLEHLFAVIKIAAIVMFLILALCAVFGWIHHEKAPAIKLPVHSISEFMPTGLKGLWSSLLFAFYAFGGIEIMGIMAIRLKKPEEAAKSGKVMLSLLTLIYLASLGLAVSLIPWESFNTKKSPFVLALDPYQLAFVPHVFNGIFIIAGFSTMVASLFAVISIIITLAKDRDAPPLLARKVWKQRPFPAIALTSCGLMVSIILALLMPGRIYEYFTTAAGLMLIYNWFFILITAGRLLKLTVWGKTKRILGMTILSLAISGTLFHPTSRPGFWISLLFIVVIGAVSFLMVAIWKKSNTKKTNESSS
jgi:L-asparagine transporter-like permease